MGNVERWPFRQAQGSESEASVEHLRNAHNGFAIRQAHDFQPSCYKEMPPVSSLLITKHIKK